MLARRFYFFCLVSWFSIFKEIGLVGLWAVRNCEGKGRDYAVTAAYLFIRNHMPLNEIKIPGYQSVISVIMELRNLLRATVRNNGIKLLQRYSEAPFTS